MHIYCIIYICIYITHIENRLNFPLELISETCKVTRRQQLGMRSSGRGRGRGKSAPDAYEAKALDLLAPLKKFQNKSDGAENPVVKQKPVDETSGSKKKPKAGKTGEEPVDDKHKPVDETSASRKKPKIRKEPVDAKHKPVHETSKKPKANEKPVDDKHKPVDETSQSKPKSRPIWSSPRRKLSKKRQGQKPMVPDATMEKDAASDKEPDMDDATKHYDAATLAAEASASTATGPLAVEDPPKAHRGRGKKSKDKSKNKKKRQGPARATRRTKRRQSVKRRTPFVWRS